MSERPTESSYHIPVLAEEAIDALRIDGVGTYVDLTYGGGGHSRPILKRMTAKGRLFGFDQDVRAAMNVPKDDRFVFVHANFRYLKHFMRYYGVHSVNGILADLGVSSHHLDEPERGFSYRVDAPLDMRMNVKAAFSAKDVINTYEADRLQQIFSRYGEVRNARTLAQRLVSERSGGEISTTGQLVATIAPLIRGDRHRYLAQVFQAIRIEVNDELGVLGEMLTQASELIAPGGRMAVITYHSLEDRMVKNFFKRGDIWGTLSSDAFGRVKRPFEEVNKKPIVPSLEERRRNVRSLSAKLRIAQKPV